MNPKAANTARAGTPAVPQKDKDAAKQCLILADKFLKEGEFDRARTEVGKAQKLDPTNPYAYAFLDRITHFEEEKKKRDAPNQEAEEVRLKAEEEEAKKLVEEARRREEAAKQKADEEKRRAEAERQRAEEEKRKAQNEERRKAEEKRQKEEEQRQKEEAQKRKAEEERQRAIAAAQKAAMEAKQKAEKQKAAEAAAARMKQEEQKKAADAARLAEQKKVDDEQRKLETFRKIDEARRKREEERRSMEGMLPLRGGERPKEKKEPEEQPKEEPKPPPAQPKPDSVVEAARPVIADVLAKRSKTEPSDSEPPKTPTPSITEILAEVSRASHSSPGTPKADLDDKLDQMRRQIEMLTNALDQERKVRDEMNQQQLKGSIKQLRAALEKAWVNGVPNEDVLAKLHENAVSLGIPEDVEQTLNREVKLDMYSKAVKQVVAKQKLLRNSSRTLEWLRTVYNVTIDEYLEYESKFLMDLVAVQYKGTILFVSSNDTIIKDLGAKLKSVGYAVVNARSPEIALEKIEKINPHYILCDMEFSAGSLSGIKFLHVLRANSKFNYIPFILMCEASEMTQLKSSELRPTEGFIQKPFDMDSLNLIMNEKLMAFREYLSSL